MIGSSKNKKPDEDPYVGLSVGGDYRITKQIGKGHNSVVYIAVRSDPEHTLACKIIPKRKMNTAWDKELKKLVSLSDVPGVVQYHGHNKAKDNNGEPFVWILQNYIPGHNLRDYLKDLNTPLDISFIEGLLKTVLEVLHACRTVGIVHGDLHEGNILIRNPDERLPNNPIKIWVTDFGSHSFGDRLSPKDDARQLFSIVSSLLHRLKFHELNPRDRLMYYKFAEFTRKILELDPTQGAYVYNPSVLLQDFERIRKEVDMFLNIEEGGEETKGPGDYLWAEAIGFRADEWKNLFVPEFLANQELLSKNITILTGARGCGKTMSFRRLTAYMDKVVGEPSGVPGSDQFIGFYLNCRDLVEAFPWLPEKLSEGTQQQIIHFYHIAWLVEICRTLEVNKDEKDDFVWLDNKFKSEFQERYKSVPVGIDMLDHVSSFLESEKERCRATRLGKNSGLDFWPLANLRFLDEMLTEIQKNVAWIKNRPFYFFLDDYTTPYVPKSVQQVLNPIVFRRRDKLFFKVSTESSNSFERTGLNMKSLEVHQDFELIDLASISIDQQYAIKEELLDKIFRRRIDRHPYLKGTGNGLRELLGKMKMNNNQMAQTMRDATRGEGVKNVQYCGTESFVGMWSSDTRAMIQVFVHLLRDAEKDLKKKNFQIDTAIQDNVFRLEGGEFMNSIEYALDPAFQEHGRIDGTSEESYGKHLKDIVEAFATISRYEMTEGKIVSNQDRKNPKQAFRIEIHDNFSINDKAERYLEGLVRWHIFMEDRRGKSIRGMTTPRLYLNRILIPYWKLTFSKHDSIGMSSKEFEILLLTPKEFILFWKKKRESGIETTLLEKWNNNEEEKS